VSRRTARPRNSLAGLRRWWSVTPMTDRTAVPERASQRAKTARRGGPSGQQAVGDYVGQPAGDAALAVRRAGLRPGLDRSFGCPAELIGLVVAQDPAAGIDMARNGMVTLYVAAPGGELVDGDAAPATASASAAEPESGEVEENEPPRVPMRVRRRKQGMARGAAPTFDPPPPPVAGDAAPWTDSFTEPGVEQPGEWPTEIDAPHVALEDALGEESSATEFPHDDDFVVHVEDVLAGRSGPAWRRAYPRRRAMRGLGSSGAVRAWVGEHRKLAGTIGAALALWTVVGVASTLGGHHARSASASAVAPSRAPDPSHRAPAPEPASAQNSNSRRAPAGPARVHRSRPGPSRAASRRPVRRAPRAARPAAPAVREAVVPAVAPAPPARAPAPPTSTAPSPAPEQTGGGLFSP
jgi:PASTA domain-containing protein